jgi:hypothetical protein
MPFERPDPPELEGVGFGFGGIFPVLDFTILVVEEPLVPVATILK